MRRRPGCGTLRRSRSLQLGPCCSGDPPYRCKPHPRCAVLAVSAAVPLHHVPLWCRCAAVPLHHVPLWCRCAMVAHEALCRWWFTMLVFFVGAPALVPVPPAHERYAVSCCCSLARCSYSAKTTSVSRIPRPSAGQPVTSTSPALTGSLSLSHTHPDSLHDSHSDLRSSCTLTVARTLSHSGSLSRSLALNKLLSGESVAPGRSPQLAQA